MTHPGHDLLQNLNLINAVSMILLVIAFFILQYIFDMEFVCSCRPRKHVNQILYLVIPPMILTWVVYITEPFHRARIFSCFRGIISGNKILCFFAELFINYVSLSALWIATVLLDGNWYICLMTILNRNQTGIPCKKDLTYEEYKILAGYKIDSLDWGLGLIGILIIVWSIAESITAYCNRRKTWKRGSWSDKLLPPYYRKVYERLLEEQVSNHLKEELTKIAEERATAICQPHLHTIKEDEQRLNNIGDGNNSVNNTVLEAWQKLSAWDLSFSSNESHDGEERAPEEPAPEEGPALEEIDSGSRSSDRLLMT